MRSKAVVPARDSAEAVGEGGGGNRPNAAAGERVDAAGASVATSNVVARRQRFMLASRVVGVNDSIHTTCHRRGQLLRLRDRHGDAESGR
mmetsp:Transcript_28839/g.85142  ORF Transcript_28839/g.85142 Transcript_28839/m.85142 type:complete len:90 (-) Transcript_28839:25-294(-)